MADLSGKMIKQREKMYVRAYVIMCLIVALIMGFYSFNRWQQYSLAKTALIKNTRFIEALRDTVGDEKATYESAKSGFDALHKEIEQKLADIFPETDQYTALVRRLDTFEGDLNKKNDPFEVSNIDFQGVMENDLYKILPLRMNIRSSAENFRKFLHMIENSGALENEIRLMDISSIRLSFESSGGASRISIINFTVQIKAYFQKIK